MIRFYEDPYYRETPIGLERNALRPFTKCPNPKHRYFEDEQADCYKISYAVMWKGKLIQLRKGGFLWTDNYQEAKRVARDNEGLVVERVTWYISAKEQACP